MRIEDEREFFMRMNSLSEILGSLNPKLCNGWTDLTTKHLIQCIDHLRIQNIILLDEVMRLSGEISKMKEKENA